MTATIFRKGWSTYYYFWFFCSTNFL